jgi:MGT family glycosyltransferase
MLERAAMVLALTPEQFDVPGPSVNPHTHYIGPILDPETAGAEFVPGPADSRPLVLISLGTTTQAQDRALPPIVQALAGLPVRGLLTLGGVGVGPLPEAPNVVVHDWLPHRQVLGATAVVVSHGGLSTVMASLAHGVPMVCIPQGRDQGLNAERVQACGAGIALAPQASPHEIAAAIDEVLRKPGYAEAARTMGELIGARAGGAAAVEHLTALCRSG